MTSFFTQKLTQSIQNHFERLGQESASTDDLHWVIEHWPQLESHTRQIVPSDLQLIEKLINTIPTGKRRYYQRALNDLLFYLADALQWTLPEKTHTALRDMQYLWFESLTYGSQQAKLFFEGYQKEKNLYFTKRGTPTAVLMTLMIGFEIAPLSLAHICQILNHPDSILTNRSMPCLRVYHLTPSQEGTPQPFTRYYLALLPYRMLNDYYAQSPSPVNLRGLEQQLAGWLTEQNQPALHRHTWWQRFQISWYLRHHLPPILIRDLAIPERHVGIPKDYPTSMLKICDIYAIDWDLLWFEHLSPSTMKTRWPHRELLKHSDSSTAKPLVPRDDPRNVLPKLLYEYTEQLLTWGGVKKSQLATNSIIKYTSLEKILEPYPLSYADASNEEEINRWAQKVYHSITIDTSLQLFVYFLRFLSVHEQTDNLDLSLFSAPTLTPSVSPARLDLVQLDTLIHSLIINNQTQPFRSLFAVIATLLGFFGMLRRGEVLRLRCQDIAFVPKNGLLKITITNTSEGLTKNGLERHVDTTIPKTYRKLFEVIVTIKQNAKPDEPFLGFHGEKYHSRQLYYLLPVARALKIHFGAHINFHHLRHSGVHLLMLQVLHFVSRTPEDLRGRSPIEQEMLSDKAIGTRFDYWLEDRTPHEVNDSLFFDEICAQVGHAHYATTRWSYLHDIDWLLPIISPSHQVNTEKDYSHAELRYLFGLSPQSNDLSRRLKILSTHYAQKSLGEKRSQTLRLSDSALRKEIFGGECRLTPPTYHHYDDWQHAIHTSTETLLGFLFKTMLLEKSLNLVDLSQIWSLGSQHDIRPIDKKQRTALRNLPPITLSEKENSLELHLAGNIKNARAFNTAFRDKSWNFLTFHFVLNSNRKLNHTRQASLIQQHYLKNKETLTHLKHAMGQTTLTIQLIPKPTLTKQTLAFVHRYISTLQSSQKDLIL